MGVEVPNFDGGIAEGVVEVEGESLVPFGVKSLGNLRLGGEVEEGKKGGGEKKNFKEGGVKLSKQRFCRVG